MFDPIRSFFTTPPKRATSSLGAGLSGEDDNSPMPAFQKAWKDGATFDDLFGPTPFTLHGAVGRSGAENHRPDVAKVETFLGDAGYYKPLTNDGPSGWHSTNLDTAIKSFQKDNGLEVDGLLKPGGPTIGKIGSLLGGNAADVEAKSEPEKYDPWEQKVGGNDPGDPKKLQPPEWWKTLGEDDDEPDSPDPWPNTVKATLPEGVPVYSDSKVADNSQMFAPRYPRPNTIDEQAKYKQEYDAWLKENWEKIQKNQVLVGQGLPPMDIPAPPLRPGEERPDPMDSSTWPGGRGKPAPAPVPQPQPAPQPAPGPDIVFGPHGGPTTRLPQTSGPTFPYPVGRDLLDILAGKPSKPPRTLSTTPPRNPFDGHTISEDGARAHDSYAANLVRDSNPDETARYLKNVITWNGDQGRGDVADLLGRFAKVDQGKAKTLQDALHRAAGERIPFRIAPLGQGIAVEAAGESGTVELPDRNPWGSAQDANRWEAGNMAKALLGKSDYKDAATHFAGEFKRDPAAARAYTAAIFEDMAATSPQQAMQFVGSMREAGLAAAAEKKPEPAPEQKPQETTTFPVAIPPAPTPAPTETPAPKPEETRPFPVPIPPAPVPPQPEPPKEPEPTKPQPPEPKPQEPQPGQTKGTDPAVIRDVDVLKDASNAPGYAKWLAEGGKVDPQWAEDHSQKVSRELYKTDPQAAENMAKEGEKAGVKVGLFADGHQATKSVDDLLTEAGGRQLSSGPDKDSKQCVALVKHAVPGLQGVRADQWKEGEKIKGLGDPPLKPGTALATFEDGQYKNKSTGNHAVVFEKYGVENGKEGMFVIEQASTLPPRRTFIPFDQSNPKRIYQGGNYSVIKRPN